MTKKIIQGLKDNKDILELREEIILFKNNGGSQKEAEKILTALRTTYKNNEAKEDKILELLDFVRGWCAAGLRIWEDA